VGLSPGTRLGPYEIVAPIGAGGMGEVYRGRDTRLDRDVAIKVLPSSLAADPEARARFEREARAVSQLNHPHICALYDVGRINDIEFLVMEYLDGESLAARLERGPLPPDEALDYAVQIADALDKAHRRGIVHRDLKPANVMLTKGAVVGRSVVTSSRTAPPIAKLLDFGLAKLAPPPTFGSTETVLAQRTGTNPPRGPANPATAQGTILGTFQYMAPEQVEGAEIDARADIWGFGCLLYEMLTGRRAFEGKTQASVIASILGRDPTPVVELQPLAPPALGRVIRICLAKDPEARFQSAYDLLLQLQWIAEGGSAAGLPAPVIERRKRRERTWWLAAAAAMLALGAAGAWFLKPVPLVSNVSEHFQFPLPDRQSFSRTGRHYLAISPDGRRLAYIADKKIHLREMHQLASHPITGTDEDPLNLMFSPDGQWIAYFVPLGSGTQASSDNFVLKKIQIIGGTPMPLCTVGWPYGASWQNHTIVFGQNSDQVHGILAVPDSAGTPTTLVTVGKDEQATQPHVIADGKLVLFTVRGAASPSVSWDLADVVVQAPGQSTRTVLVKGATDGQLITNRLVYYRDGSVFGIGVDSQARATRGGPVPIVEGVQSTTAGAGGGLFAIADNGTLAFVPGAGTLNAEPRQLVWVDRQGKEEKIAAPERPYRHPRLSPDGTRIVVADDNIETAGLYTWELDRQVLTRLSPSGDHRDDHPLWTRDGRAVIYRFIARDGTGKIMRIDASGAGMPEPLLDLARVDDVQQGIPESISPDGKVLTLRIGAPLDVVALSLESTDRTLRKLVAGPTFEYEGVISPKGEWLSYVMGDAPGPGQIFVRPYPDVTRDRWQVSPVRAGDPVWARSGRELFFLSAAGKMLGVTVQPGPVFGRATELFDTRVYMEVGAPGIDYDTAPDGRFLMIKKRGLDLDATASPTITIITHWLDELRARVK
jgi:serine/threonine protein kinase